MTLRPQPAHNGAQILSESGDARDGFHFEYKLGKSIGTLIISSLSIDTVVHRTTPLGQGLVDVNVRIKQSETRFPKAPGRIMACVVDDPRNSSPSGLRSRILDLLIAIRQMRHTYLEIPSLECRSATQLTLFRLFCALFDSLPSPGHLYFPISR